MSDMQDFIKEIVQRNRPLWEEEALSIRKDVLLEFEGQEYEDFEVDNEVERILARNIAKDFYQMGRWLYVEKKMQGLGRHSFYDAKMPIDDAFLNLFNSMFKDWIRQKFDDYDLCEEIAEDICKNYMKPKETV